MAGLIGVVSSSKDGLMSKDGFIIRDGVRLSGFTATAPGIYNVNGSGDLIGLNDYGTLLVFNNIYPVHIFIPVNSQSKLSFFKRTCVDGHWSGWVQFTGVTV